MFKKLQVLLLAVIATIITGNINNAKAQDGFWGMPKHFIPAQPYWEFSQYISPNRKRAC